VGKTREPAPPSARRRSRYTIDRFFHFVSPKTRKHLEAEWAEGNLLRVCTLPRDALPVVLLMAAYAKTYDVDIVDDYEHLLSRFQDELTQYGTVNHYDLYLCSSVVVNYENYRPTGRESLIEIGMNRFWDELFGEPL
jgi:hypothetical protein